MAPTNKANYKTFEAQARLIRAIVAAHPDTKWNYKGKISSLLLSRGALVHIHILILILILTLSGSGSGSRAVPVSVNNTISSYPLSAKRQSCLGTLHHQHVVDPKD